MTSKERHTATLQMIANDGAQQLNRADIQGDKGFVQHPQPGRAGDQARQGHTPLLSLRKHPGRQVFPTTEANAAQRGNSFLLG